MKTKYGSLSTIRRKNTDDDDSYRFWYECNSFPKCDGIVFGYELENKKTSNKKITSKKDRMVLMGDEFYEDVLIAAEKYKKGQA